MTRRPLFSTYSHGENRVTGSMVAVFERLGLNTLERILAAATEETTLELVSFDLVRPEGPGTVPDARIASSFKYLFETKTAYDALRAEQLRGHLAHLDGPYADQRLFVVTPDADEPLAIGELASDQIRWFNFAALSGAIDAALAEEDVPDDERFLLRELQALFIHEGLLGRQDTVVVAAARTHGFYLKHAAYVCQAGRAFRPGLQRLAFYRRRQIEREIPRILDRRDNIVFAEKEARRLRSTGDPLDASLAEVIEGSVADESRIPDHPYQVFLLTPAGDPSTFCLPQPIRHETDGRGSAFTMGQRYAYFADIERVPKTTAELR